MKNNNENRRLRTAVIGAGTMGFGHLDLIHNHFSDRIDLQVVVDPRPAARTKAKNELSVPAVCENVDELVEKHEFDLVVIATPNHKHYDVLKKVSKKNRIIICEKPLANNLKNSREIYSLAKGFSGKLYFNLELRSGLAISHLHKIIQDGKIGDPHFAWCKEFRRPFLEKPDCWIQQKKYSGGTLVEKCVHHFDLFGWLFNSKPVNVMACGGHDVIKNLYGQPYDVLDNAAVNVEYEGSKRASLMVCMFINNPLGPHLELGVIGSEGMAICADNSVHITDTDGIQIEKIEFNVPEEIAAASHNGKLYYQYENILNDINGTGNKPVAKIEDVYWATLTGLAAELSAEEKRLVDIQALEQ